jgi:carboxyl-terminal processing protease
LPPVVVAYDGIQSINRDGIAIVGAVAVNSPAEKAGVKVGDALLDIDGSDIHSLGPNAIDFYLAGSPGMTKLITIMSTGQSVARTLTIQLTAVPRR